MLPPIVLASQSPARRQLLKAAGIPHRVQPSYFDESQIQSSNPVELVQKLASAKAEVVAAQQREPVLVVGADSVLYLNGEILGKPPNALEAERRLRQMRGEVGELYTGHALIDTKQNRRLTHYAVTRVFFAKPSDEEIRAYVATGEPLACAGCFAIDGRGSLFVERIEGCPGNVIGLSLPLLRRMMQELGYSLTDAWSMTLVNDKLNYTENNV
ncbi:septum formation protein [Thermostichus sp. MS-CIW-40]|jgi:septum formation protein